MTTYKKSSIIHTDEALLDRLHKNDESAMTELFDRYWNPIFISSYNILKNKELCEDIVQEVFLSVWNRRSNLKIKSTFKNYLFACARYQVFDKIRKKGRLLEAELFENIDIRVHYNSPESELMYNELLQQINSAVERLPKRCKTVFVLSRNEQLSHAEISDRLDISTKTVENHMTKALRIIRSSLGIFLSAISYMM